MSRKLFDLDCHQEAVSIHGLRSVLRTMRWSELEQFASELEIGRRGGEDKPTKKKVTAELINQWIWNS